MGKKKSGWTGHTNLLSCFHLSLPQDKQPAIYCTPPFPKGRAGWGRGSRWGGALTEKGIVSHNQVFLVTMRGAFLETAWHVLKAELSGWRCFHCEAWVWFQHPEVQEHCSVTSVKDSDESDISLSKEAGKQTKSPKLKTKSKPSEHELKETGQRK